MDVLFGAGGHTYTLWRGQLPNVRCFRGRKDIGYLVERAPHLRLTRELL